MADHSVEIAEIEKILASGAKTVIVDGVQVTRDLAELRRHLSELRGQDAAAIASGQKRPRIARINLTGF